MVIFSPMLLGVGKAAGLAVIAMEFYEFLTPQNENLGIGVTAAMAAAMLVAGETDFVMAALGPALEAAMANLDPVERQAVNAVLPQIVDVAVDQISQALGITGSGAAAGAPAVAGGAVAMVFRMLSMALKRYIVVRMEEFGEDATAGAQLVLQDIQGFADGSAISPYFRPFIDWCSSRLRISDVGERPPGLPDHVQTIGDFIQYIYDGFINNLVDAVETAMDQGGTVTVVQDEDGEPTVVPTQPDGTPTDINGEPLPGGMAPSPNYDNATLPENIASPPDAPMGIDAGVLAGAGGVAALFLAVTGAI